MASVQLELQTNMTNLIKDLVEDEEANVFGSRLVSSSGLRGMRVSCFYHQLFSRTMDLSKIGKYRRSNHCKDWINKNNITFIGKSEYLRIEVPVEKFLRDTSTGQKRLYKLEEIKIGYDKDYINKAYQSTELPTIYLQIHKTLQI